ncbi:MAG: DUF4178 domain-containing protein [Deltaproteobacteria bacterium]|nr:DUF4178 domain-containing protein [Deltaproteobacteria bacterium]
MSTGVASACPQCGAPLRFGGGASLAAVCSHCRSSVLRSGARLELAGRVPDLVATDTRLALGATGRLQGRSFVVLGRLQLSQGAAPWNEWYLGLDDGSWAWLAEAQGRLYLTRRVDGAGALPRLDELRPGLGLELPGAGPATVEEVGEARLLSFEGELPVAPRPGEAWGFADCSTGGEGFATIDYGGDEPVLYAGREIGYADAGLEGLAPPPQVGDEPARALACPGCGAAVLLRQADARSFGCPSCRSLLDVSAGDLRVLQVMEARSDPPLPLGSRGTLRGEPLTVLGFLVRSIDVDGERYPWQELLLHGPGGYRWLSVYGGHWLLLRPVAGAKLREVAGRIRFEGRTFKHFQGGKARYDEIQGELPWEVRAGEEVETADFVAPPFLLSAETTGQERSWSHGEHLSGAELWKAFGLPGGPPREVGVGAAQPNPHAAVLGRTWAASGLAAAALLALALATWLLLPRQPVLAVQVPLDEGQVTLSPPFELTGGPQAVEIEARADVSQAWIGLDVALIHDESGESEAVAFELSHFSGVDGGESWSEGSREGSAVVGQVADGRYLLRVEPHAERGRGTLPPAAQVRVVRGPFLLAPLLLALLLLSILPVWRSVRAVGFEKRRWAESDHPWSGE